MLVKASIAGAIVTNTLFMLGASFLLGGLKHHDPGIQPGQRPPADDAAFPGDDRAAGPVGSCRRPIRRAARLSRTKLSVGLSVLLIAAYGLGLLFSLRRIASCSAPRSGRRRRGALAARPCAATLPGVTVLVALVSEVFVESVQQAAKAFGMTPAFVGFVVVALVGGAAEMATAFSAARKNRLDLSVGIALGSAAQIALFVAPVLVLLSYVIGPEPMDLQFWPGAVVMILIATVTRSW